MTQTINIFKQNFQTYKNLLACLTCFWAFHYIVLWSSSFIPENSTSNLDLSSDLIWIIAVSCNAFALAVFSGFISKLRNLNYLRFSRMSCITTAIGIALITTRLAYVGFAWDISYLIGIALLGIGTGFFMACLGELFCTMQPQTTFMGMAAGFVGGSLLSLIVTVIFVPIAVWIVTTLLPLAVAFFYRRALLETRKTPESIPTRQTTKDTLSPSSFLLLVAVIGVTAGIMRFTSHASSTAMVGDHVFTLAVLATGLVLLALSSSIVKLQPTLLLQIVIIAIAGAFIALALLAREVPVIAFVLHTAAFLCFVALVWFFCTYFAHKNASGSRGFSVGLLANQAGQALGSLGYFGAVVLFGSTDSLSLYISLGVVYALFVVALIFFANMNRAKQSNLSQLASSDLQLALDTLSSHYDLTPRETEIALLIAEGNSRSSIAEALTVSQETVKTHIKHLYQKLNIHSRDELVKLLLHEIEHTFSL